MEMLSFLIHDKCNTKLRDPLKVARDGPVFSLLRYADDLVPFAKDDLKNSQSIKDVLDSFCDIFGLKVNLTKSKIYISPNVSQQTHNSLCQVIGFISTPNLGKYLGFPLKQPGSTGHDFDFIIDRVKSKLAGWKANLLSMAGRIVLTTVVSIAILACIMQGTILRCRVHNSLDKINKNFLWGTAEEKKKIHLVNWRMVTKHKEEWGLGIKAVKQKNLSLTTKLC